MTRPDEPAAGPRSPWDDLDPDEITAALGAPSTKGRRKGQIVRGRVTGVARETRTGGWILSARHRCPGDLGGPVAGILARLARGLAVRRRMGAAHRGEFFCGPFLTAGNEQVGLAAATLRAAADRGLPFGLGIHRGD